jgi:hypothetical protein
MNMMPTEAPVFVSLDTLLHPKTEHPYTLNVLPSDSGDVLKEEPLKPQPLQDEKTKNAVESMGELVSTQV